MDDSIYKALIGEPPSSAEHIAAIANALRRKREFGELGALTGDRVLSPFGSGMITSADSQAGEIGQNRRAENSAAGLEAWRKAQLDDSTRNRVEQERHNREAERLAGIRADKDDGDARSLRADQFYDRQTTAFKDKMQQYGVPDVLSSAATLNNSLTKYLSPIESGGKGMDSVPGIGYATNTRLGAALSSPDSKLVKSQVVALNNALLKMASGLAVTQPEYARRLQEMMLNPENTSADFVRAWPQTVKRINNIVQNLSAVHPEVRRRYSEYGGLPLDPIQAYGDLDQDVGDESDGDTDDSDSEFPTPSRAAIQHFREHPELENEFIKKYGPDSIYKIPAE
jgi:hypothetical protein